MNTLPTLSFFNQRMSALGLTDKNNRVTVINPDADFPMNLPQEVPIFSEDSEGNIDILFWTLDRNLITYTKFGTGKTAGLNAKMRTFKLKRLKEPKGDMKYLLPQSDNTDLKEADSATHPWFHPALCEKFEKGEKIKTLYLTEGVFKAFKACESGIDCVGLTSVTHYANRAKQLHEDIMRLIIACAVEYVVILWDGDCLNISEKQLIEREPITQRPSMFFAAAKRIRGLIDKYAYPTGSTRPNIWFAHIKSDCFTSKPKGLDDLLMEAENGDKLGAVVKESQNLQFDDFFFVKHSIDKTTELLYQYFGLKSAEYFYNRHRERIGVKEFYWWNDQYKYDEDKNELKLLAPGWAKQVQFIGDEFFEEKVVPGAMLDRRQLLPRKVATLKRLYGDDFYRFIRDKHCVTFCNMPNHFEYEQLIVRENARYYNRYFPFKWMPQEGRCSKSLAFVKHIFGTAKVIHPLSKKEVETWEMGLDYIQLLLTKPTQVLPVLCFYSPENNTGKSTFTSWLIKIFGDNAIQIGNNDLQSEFNEQYADKLLAICEETLLERKRDAERIKAMSTAKQMSVNPKGSAQYTIDFFTKFIFNSNNKRMIYVTQHDERFWIIQVHKFKGPDNTKLEYELEYEIPAFIHFLKNRQLATESQSRMHFHPALIRTTAFEEAVKVNEPNEATNLREEILNMFLQSPNLEQIEMTLGDIRDVFFAKKDSNKWIQEIVQDYIKVDLERDGKGSARFRRGKFTKWISKDVRDESGVVKGSEVVPIEVATRGRHYIFLRENFVDADKDLAYWEDELPQLYSELSELRQQFDKLKEGNLPRSEVQSKIERLEAKIAKKEEEKQTDLFPNSWNTAKENDATNSLI